MELQQTNHVEARPPCSLSPLQPFPGVVADLARAEALLAALDADAAIPLAVDALHRVRNACPPASWRAVSSARELAGLRAKLHEDPYTRRGADKPRGYPGDAVLLDYIYGCAPLPDGTTRVGQAVYRWCFEKSGAFHAVRDRRVRLARAIDACADRVPSARVLSLACGHLREASLSSALVGGRLAELWAFDQDPQTLAVVRATGDGLPVRCVPGTLSDLLKGRIALPEFDLIYAAGLLDYLPDPVARGLLTLLCQKLNPGGELLVANFVTCWESAYMEAAMDWYLTYRTPAALLSLAGTLPGARVEVEPRGIIAYLTIRREG